MNPSSWTWSILCFPYFLKRASFIFREIPLWSWFLFNHRKLKFIYFQRLNLRWSLDMPRSWREEHWIKLAFLLVTWVILYPSTSGLVIVFPSGWSSQWTHPPPAVQGCRPQGSAVEGDVWQFGAGHPPHSLRAEFLVQVRVRRRRGPQPQAHRHWRIQRGHGPWKGRLLLSGHRDLCQLVQSSWTHGNYNTFNIVLTRMKFI